MLIEFETKARKDLKAITSSDRTRILAKIEQYARNPESLANQVKKLIDSPYHRLRVGDYRVIFSLIDDTVAVMVVIRVRHRREVYE